MKIEHLIIYLMLIVGFLFYLLYLESKTALQEQAPEYTTMVTQAAEMKKKNMQLKNQLSQKEAYTTIDKKAKQEGFVSAKYIYLK